MPIVLSDLKLLLSPLNHLLRARQLPGVECKPGQNYSQGRFLLFYLKISVNGSVRPTSGW